MNSSRFGVFALMAAAVAVRPSIAQEIEVEEVVVSSTPLRENTAEMAQPAAVIGGDELRRKVASSIGETLAAEPGISATYFGPAASRPVIRGLGGDRVLMLEDGVSALDVSTLSQDHAVSIEAVLADRIEILKGPATLLFGSGAVGGIVNVVGGRIPADFAAPAEVGGALEVRGDTALGERSGVGRLDLGTAGFRVHLDGFRRDTDDMEIPGFAFSAAERAEHMAAEGDEEFEEDRLRNSASETRGGALGFSAGNELGFAGFSWSRFDTNYGIPAHHAHSEGESEAEEAVRVDMVQDRYDFKAERTAKVGPFSAIRLRGTYNDYEHHELEGAAIGTLFQQQALDTRLTLEHAQPPDIWHGVFGLQYVNTDFNAIGEEAFVPASITDTWGLFVFEQRNFTAFSLELGARAENQRIRLQEGSRYEEMAYSLSAGAVWKLDAARSLSMNLTRSQRHPQSAELFANGVHLAAAQFELGEARLHEETAHTVDLTLHAHGETGPHWSLGTFYNDYADFIFAAATGEEREGFPVFQYGQDDAEFYGFEGEITWPLQVRGAGQFELRLASDYVRARLKDGGNLPRIPPLRYGMELHYELDRLHLGLESFFYADQSKTAANERATGSYTMLDADVSYRFIVGKRASLLAFLRATNLLDEEARRHTSPLKEVAPLPGRSVSAGIRMEF